MTIFSANIVKNFSMITKCHHVCSGSVYRKVPEATKKHHYTTIHTGFNNVLAKIPLLVFTNMHSLKKNMRSETINNNKVTITVSVAAYNQKDQLQYQSYAWASAGGSSAPLDLDFFLDVLKVYINLTS